MKSLEVDIPKGRLTAVTGVSGSGKTTLILESLVPGLTAAVDGQKLPDHVLAVEKAGIRQVKLIDATPIGVNVRSTVATYANVHDELRKIYAKTPDAKALGFKAGDFFYNTGKLRCPVCDGTGVIDLDVQFLPDVTIPCPECHGSRYGKDADRVRHGGHALPELMAMDVNTALEVCKDLKLASEMGRAQAGSLFVFDEPTIGLHRLDVRTLLWVFQTLIGHGATVVVIEHDLDVIRNSDYLIDMGPGGGDVGGRVVAMGTPEKIARDPDSVTGQYLGLM